MPTKKFKLQISALRGAVIGVVIIAALTLHGCSFMQAAGMQVTGMETRGMQAQGGPPDSTVTRTSVQYFSWLRSLTDEELHLERLRLESAYKTNTGFNLIERVQLALLLSTIRPADTDNLLLALSLLTDVNSMEEPADHSLYSDYAEFAQLWYSALLQQASVLTISQQQAGLIERLQERSLLLHNDNLLLREQNQSLLKQQTLSQEEIHNLQLQIDALKEIEQQLNQREQLQESP